MSVTRFVLSDCTACSAAPETCPGTDVAAVALGTGKRCCNGCRHLMLEVDPDIPPLHQVTE